MRPLTPLTPYRAILALTRRMAQVGALLTLTTIAILPTAHAQWMDVATISNTLTNTPGRLCVGGGRTDIGCPTNAPLLDSAAGLLTVPGDLRIIGNLYVSGSQQFDGVTFANGGVSATGTITATTFTGSGAGLNNIPASAIVGLSTDRIVSTSANVVAGNGGTISFTTGGVSGTAYIDTTGRFVAAGVSTTGGISGTTGYFTNTVNILGNLDMGGSGAPRTITRVRTIRNDESAGISITTTGGGPITFSPSSTEALRIVSTGLVGIGTTSPIAKFHVYTGASGINHGSFTPTVFMESGGTDGRYSVLQVASNGSNGTFRVANDGKVGIQTLGGTVLSAALQVSGTLRIANGGESCDANRIGAIRYTAGDFQFCRNGTAWEALSTVADSAAPDRIISGTTTLQVVSSTGFISLTQAGTNTGWFSPQTGLVTLGVSATGGISGTTGYFANSVGIGTTTPNATLDVSGTISATIANFYGRGALPAVNIFTSTNNGALNIKRTIGTAQAITSYATENATSVSNPLWHTGIIPGSSNFSITKYDGTTSRLLNFTPTGLAGMNNITAPSVTLDIGASIRLAAETSSTLNTCDTNRLGAIRYGSGSFDICRSTANGWEPLATATSATDIAINTGLSGSIVFRDELGKLKANNTFSISSTTGSVGIGAGAPGFIGDNALYTTGSIFTATNSSIGLTNGPVMSVSGGIPLMRTNSTFPIMRDLAFSNGINAPEVMRIVSTGYVGIGTTNPSSTLHIMGTSATTGGITIGSSENNTNRLAITAMGTSSAAFRMLGSGNFNFYGNTNNPFIVFNPTIGSLFSTGAPSGINPSTTLHVSGTLRIANGGESCDTDRTGAIRYSAGQFQICRNTVTGWETLVAGGSGTVDTDRITSGTTSVITYNNASATIATAGTERLIVGTNGKVGINKNIPDSDLHVVASGFDGNTVTFEGNDNVLNLIGTRLDGTEHAAIRVFRRNNSMAALEAGQPLASLQAFGSDGSIDQQGAYIGMHAESNFSNNRAPTFIDFGTRGPNDDYADTRMRITGSGLVGMGSYEVAINPSTSLHVGGTLRIADGGETCDTNRTGAIRFTAGQFEVCRNGTTWETMVAGSSGSVDTDRITSGTTNVITNGTSNYISLTTTGSTWGYLSSLASYIPNLSTNSLSATTVSASTLNVANISATGNVSVTGNVSANRFIGDGSGLTGVIASTGDRLVSGTTSMVAISNTGYISVTQAGINTAWFNPQTGLVSLGVSTTGVISTSGIYLQPTTTGGYSQLYTNPTIFANGFGFRNDGVSSSFVSLGNDLRIGTHRSNAVTQEDIIFFHQNSTSTTTSLFLRGTDGYAGFGTTAPTTALSVSGTLRIANGGESCDTDRTGAIRFTSGQFQVCRNGTTWETLVAGGSGSVDTDRITSGTTSVIAYNNTSATIATAGTERLIVGTNGNIGIAQQPETGVALAVSGSTKIRGKLNLGVYNAFSGSYDIFIGNNTGVSNTAATVTAVGNAAARNNVGSNLTAYGQNAALDNSGNNVTALGESAAFSNTVGNVTAVGYEAARENAGTYVTAIGEAAAYSNNRDNVTAIGYNAAYNNNAYNVTAIGNGSAYNNQGSELTAVGIFAAYNNSAQGITAIGYSALSNNNNGTNNTAVGYEALSQVTAGNFNTALGYAAGQASGGSIFSGNTLLGAYTGTALTTGSSNTIVGANSGMTLTTGGNNILLGANLTTPLATTSNYLSIGNAIFGDIASGLGYANRIGINVAAPTVALEVSGTISATNITAGNFILPTVSGSAGVSMSSPGDNLGNHTATQNLAMGGFNITGVGSISASGNVSVTGNVSANRFIGDGSLLTNISASAINGLSADRLTSGSLAVTANSTTSIVSLSTAGTTWGYLGSLASYLPNLSSNAISTSNISVTTINGAPVSSLGTTDRITSGTTSVIARQNGPVTISATALNIGTTDDDGDPDTLYIGLRTGENPVSGTLAIGHYAANNNTGLDVTAFGNSSALSNTGWGITAIGRNATEGNTGSYITAVGANAAQANTGSNLTAFGQNVANSNAANNVTAIGENAAEINTGNHLVALGYFAGQANTGANVTAIGSNAAIYNTAPEVTAVGSNSAANNTGEQLSALGVDAANHNSGTNVTALGYSAANFNAGNNLIAIGSTAAYSNSGGDVIAIGPNAAQNNTADLVTAVGPGAAENNTGLIVTAVGDYAAQNNTGQSVMAFGSYAASNNTGNMVTAIGNGAASSNSGAEVIAMGYYAASSNQTAGTIAIGNDSLSANTTGLANTATGFHSLMNNVTGSYNTALGYAAGQGVSANSFSANTLLGAYTGTALTTGSSNTIVGANSGMTLTTGGNNILLGAGLTTPLATTSNYLSIGNAIFGDIASGLGYANKIGINTATPSTELEVSGTITATRFVGDGSGLTGIGGGNTDRITSGTTSVIANQNGPVTISATALNIGTFDEYGDPDSIYIGVNTGLSSTSYTLAIGHYAASNSNSSNLTAIGYYTAEDNTGDFVIAMGDSSARINQGNYLTAIGYAAAESNDGDYVNAIGFNAAYANSGAETTAIGSQAAWANSGNDVIAIGQSASRSNTANGTIAIGSDSLSSNFSGLANTAVGFQTFMYSEYGSYNTALGYAAGQGDYANSFSGNTLLGSYTGTALTTGSSNTIVGANSGMTLTTGENNILLGAGLTTPLATTSNYLSIGNAIFGDIASGLGYANKIGINTATPSTELEVSGTITATRFVGDGSGLTGVGGGAGDRISTTGVVSGSGLAMVVAGAGNVSFTLAGVNGAAYLHPTLGFVGPGISTTGTISGTVVATPVLKLIGVSGSAGVSMTSGGGSDNLGNHTATQALNMANFGITSVTTISASSTIKTTAALQAGNTDTTCSGAADYGKIRFDAVTKRAFLCRP